MVISNEELEKIVGSLDIASTEAEIKEHEGNIKEMQDDVEKRVAELLNKIDYLSSKLTAKKIYDARKEGRVVLSPDELKCDKHPNASFEVKELGSGPITKRYFCSGWDMYARTHKGESRTIAYECPQCGIVYGSPDDHNSYRFLYCIICDTKVAFLDIPHISDATEM